MQKVELRIRQLIGELQINLVIVQSQNEDLQQRVADLEKENAELKAAQALMLGAAE